MTYLRPRIYTLAPAQFNRPRRDAPNHVLDAIRRTGFALSIGRASVAELELDATRQGHAAWEGAVARAELERRARMEADVSRP